MEPCHGNRASWRVRWFLGIPLWAFREEPSGFKSIRRLGSICPICNIIFDADLEEFL